MHILIVGGTRRDRLRRARELATSGSSIVRLDDVERAFPDHQRGGTRFVLTQSSYVMQTLVDSIAPGDRIVATADRPALTRTAPEAFEGRGPWHLFDLVDIGNSTTTEVTEDLTEDTDITRGQDHTSRSCAVFTVPSCVPSVPSVVELLARAFESADAIERLALSRDAASREPESALAMLALASAAREQDDMASARDALDRAIRLSPRWAAAHYEDGKFWLGYDDLARARDAFRKAADLMPTFSAAFSNLGATLGELDEPDAALAAFGQALAHDPRGFQIVNNIGVTTRELGRLDESETAFRRVIALAPAFVFGYYNLGHTLFLAGKYADALAAYEEGQRRDPEKNRRQGCRLAMMRLANGDQEGAARDLWRFANEAPPSEREDLLLEAYEIAHALASTDPFRESGRGLADQIAAAIGALQVSGTTSRISTTEDTEARRNRGTNDQGPDDQPTNNQGTNDQ